MRLLLFVVAMSVHGLVKCYLFKTLFMDPVGFLYLVTEVTMNSYC